MNRTTQLHYDLFGCTVYFSVFDVIEERFVMSYIDSNSNCSLTKKTTVELLTFWIRGTQSGIHSQIDKLRNDGYEKSISEFVQYRFSTDYASVIMDPLVYIVGVNDKVTRREAILSEFARSLV